MKEPRQVRGFFLWGRKLWSADAKGGFVAAALWEQAARAGSVGADLSANGVQKKHRGQGRSHSFVAGSIRGFPTIAPDCIRATRFFQFWDEPVVR
ncbi:MAG TPA: hypothetical protein DEO91_05990 [Pseudomonas sp.]|nr:hypothetical protein [Pseudomonas sp.]